ncbi:MAG: hypothetical protein ACFE9C_18470, partial [Candidatus Hodarchaeota archaeon]
MKRNNSKILRILLVLSFSLIFVALIINNNDFFRKDYNNEQPENSEGYPELNDGLQEVENLSAYQKFQEFWNSVFLQNASDWNYLDWRNFIIMEIYGTPEEDLNNTIRNDPVFENNIDIFTVYVMGEYNGSLTMDDIINLKSQLIHNTVQIGDISFLKCDDAQLRICVNIEVKSSPSMWYVADSLEIYLKSVNSSGKWFNESGDHYVKVYDFTNLEISDPIYWDWKFKNCIIGPTIINTNKIEENVTIKVKLKYFLNFLLEDYVEEAKIFNISDDDISPPEIAYTYTGDFTDGNPGELLISVLDDSGLSIDPSGVYNVPNRLGSHEFFFYALDGDNDRANDTLSSNKTIWINIIDDDTEFPNISIEYKGGNRTDGSPGCFFWRILDSDNGIGGDHDENCSITNIKIDYIPFDGLSNEEIIIPPTSVGNWSLPSHPGNYTITIFAQDNDDDRSLYNDSLSIEIESQICLTDDDITPPEINYTYTGDYTDGNPGELIINAFDFSGLSLDPSGTYQVPNTTGNHKFIFTACDADNDRTDDMLNTTIIVWINVTDDDITPPEINYTYTGDFTDGNPGELIINASDFSGLSIDPSGTYQVPNTTGNHKFTFIACDADNDRIDDMLNTTIIVWINVTDDDITPPEINYTYTGDFTDGNPGELIINASDFSGLSIDPSGTYQVPNTTGNHKFTFIACDADNDRIDDMLNTTIIVWINVTDDDITPPEITYTYTGNYTDGNPGELIVNASDFSGLSVDPSGIYQVPNVLGCYKFVFTAYDADNDRLDDMLNTTIIVWINITDDDEDGPILHSVTIINNDVYDYYEAIIIDILAEDESGISELYILFNGSIFYDTDGDYRILIENPRIPGIYNFTIIIIDGDNDR